MKGLSIEQMEFLVGKGLSAEELLAFAKMSDSPKSKGAERTARWRARKQGNVTESVTGDVTRDASPPPIDNHTPPVSSDEETRPAPKSKRKAAIIVAAKPEGVTDRVWRDFTGQRKTPVTETALEGICQEAAKAGWPLNTALTEAVSRGWQSFKAEWVEPKSTGPPGSNVSFLDTLAARSAKQSASP